MTETDTHKWRNELARMAADWQAVYNMTPRGPDWQELCQIADMEFQLEQMTLRARAAEQSGIDLDRRARKAKR